MSHLYVEEQEPMNVSAIGGEEVSTSPVLQHQQPQQVQEPSPLKTPMQSNPHLDVLSRIEKQIDVEFEERS